jgi:hypothetical protein
MSQAQRTPQPLPCVRNTSSGSTTPRSLQPGKQEGGNSRWRAGQMVSLVSLMADCKGGRAWLMVSAHQNM